MRMPDLILGVGEVGETVFDLLTERGFDCVGVDVDPSKCRNCSGMIDGVQNTGAEYLHVCIPGGIATFDEIVLDCISKCKDSLGAILIHSTVRPGTTARLGAVCDIPILSAPTRGVHRRFLEDMKRYTKFVATDGDLTDAVRAGVEARFKKVAWMSNTKTLELAKILTDTTYYGWLISYAQMTKMICDAEGIDYDEMWEFAKEPHEILGNRPKMYPGIIGGHCVIPNLDLVEYEGLDTIRRINELYKNFERQTST